MKFYLYIQNCLRLPHWSLAIQNGVGLAINISTPYNQTFSFFGIFRLVAFLYFWRGYMEFTKLMYHHQRKPAIV